MISLDGCTWVCQHKTAADAADPNNLCSDPIVLNDAATVMEEVQRQKNWLDETLKRIRERDAKTGVRSLIIINSHWPIYSRLSGHGPTGILISELRPILKRHRVNIYAFGHDHGLQLFYDPFDSSAGGGGGGMIHLGSGGGGWLMHGRKEYEGQIDSSVSELYFALSYGFWTLDVFTNSTYTVRAFQSVERSYGRPPTTHPSFEYTDSF